MKTYTAKTIEELLDTVAAEKGCPKEALIYFVTDEKKGLLGLGGSVSANVYCLDDVKEFIFNYIGEFFQHLNQEISIEIFIDGEDFRVILNGENNGMIIGQNGQTLQAINVVLKAAVNSTFKRRFNILVDVNDYKENKYERVKSLAHRLARNVQRTKVNAVLENLTNDERKVVHQELADMPNIKTESEGEGKYRHLVIKYVESSQNEEN